MLRKLFALPWHRSTYVVAAMVALLMIVIVYPGELTSPLGGNFGGGYTATYDHGWPLTFLTRAYRYDFSKSKTFPDIPKWGVPWLAWDNWQIWEVNDGPTFRPIEGVNSWKLINLFADVGAVALVVAATATLWELRRRHSRHVMSFSLRDVVVAMTAAACLLGWGVHAKHVRTREARLAETLEGDGVMTYESSIAPRWLQRFAGTDNLPELFLRVDGAYFHDVDDPAEFRSVIRVCRDLKRLRTVELSVDAGLPLNELQALLQLRVLKIYVTKLSADQIASLAQLQQLRLLLIESASDADQKELQSQLPNCQVINDWSDPNWLE